MTKQNSNLIGRPVAGASRGVTLVELLVVVTILSIIFAVLIPRLRAVNEDRNIREAARVVASAFSSASARAINDGTAGLMIVPNRNFQQATFDNFENDGFDAPYFAGTRIFQMRRLPPYVGDDQNAMATIASGTTVTISVPFEHDEGAGGDGIVDTDDDTEPRLIVQVNDEIRLNNSSYRYRITRVNPPPPGPRTGTLTLTIALGSAPRLQSVGAMVPFVIHRQPRRLDSSLVELPDGYIIDLRYSGPVLPGTDAGSARAGTFFNQNQTVADGGEPSSIVLQFDITGGVSRMFFVDTNNLPTVGTEAIN